MRRILSIPFLSAMGAVFGAATMLAQGAPQGPVKVQPPASVKEKANTPAPPANAQKATSVGKGKLTAHTANAASDTDSLWVEKIDVDGDGNVDEASLLWDDEDKVLYMWKEGTFTCANGGTGSGGMLIAVYGKGNTHNKPAGSGWWAAELDKEECAAKAAGIYGCRFDANGNSTACGLATVDDKNDDIVIAAVSK